MAEQPRGFEYKHVECAQISEVVDLVSNDHAKFYWELTGTQTIVAKESHLEGGGFIDSVVDTFLDNPDETIYSVTTTERFVAMDFRRATDIPNLQKIKELERESFELCVSLKNLGGSPFDNYSIPPPPTAGNPTLAYTLLLIAYLFYIVPGILFQRSSLFNRLKIGQDVVDQYQGMIEQYRVLKSSLDFLLSGNSSILNISL